MFWNTLISGEALKDWITNLVPDPVANPAARFDKGRILDPFITSMRNTKAISEWLEDVKNGQPINRGGNGNQAYTDLKRAKLINTDSNANHILTDLGEITLNNWIKHGINNSDDADELSRMLFLIIEARKSNTEFYVDMADFWREVRNTGQAVSFILSPESLYLMGLLCNKLNGFSPWEFIKRNHLQFQPTGTIEQLKQQFNGNTEIEPRLDKLESWLRNSASRPTGRQRFCLAMEILSLPKAEAISLINESSLNHLVGNCTEDLISEALKSFGRLNIGQNDQLIAENRIFYGAPGTGKSTEARRRVRGARFTTTTFHPATDYGSFVGYYKPLSKVNANGDVEVFYGFQPQHFLKAYVSAWKNLKEEQFLLIEEINRGNCAKIFGDIFQLLDRDEQGFSDYVISVDSDIADYLEKELKLNSQYKEAIKAIVQEKNHYEICVDDVFTYMCLPNNLSIFATMNTSDQSLFPMDSAFKRRWNWTYIPINTPEDSVYIEIGSDKYDWFDFVKKANKKIALVTESEDKKIGTFFVKHKNNSIGLDEFVNKVLFYLWNDIYKDEYTSDLDINVFIAERDNSEVGTLLYSELYDDNDINLGVVKKLLDANSINKVTN